MKDVPSFHVTVTVVGMRVYPEGDGSTFSERKGYCISYTVQYSSLQYLWGANLRVNVLKQRPRQLLSEGLIGTLIHEG